MPHFLLCFSVPFILRGSLATLGGQFPMSTPVVLTPTDTPHSWASLHGSNSPALGASQPALSTPLSPLVGSTPRVEMARESTSSTSTPTAMTPPGESDRNRRQCLAPTTPPSHGRPANRSPVLHLRVPQRDYSSTGTGVGGNNHSPVAVNVDINNLVLWSRRHQAALSEHKMGGVLAPPSPGVPSPPGVGADVRGMTSPRVSGSPLPPLPLNLGDHERSSSPGTRIASALEENQGDPDVVLVAYLLSNGCP